MIQDDPLMIRDDPLMIPDEVIYGVSETFLHNVAANMVPHCTIVETYRSRILHGWLSKKQLKQ